MKPWQYITSSIAILCTGVMLCTNVLAAVQGTDTGIWRFIMVSVSIGADLGLIGFLFAITENHKAGNGSAVFLAFLVWIVCGAYTGIQSTRWLEGQFNSMMAPAVQTESERKSKLRYLTEQIAAERVHLSAAEQAALNAITQMKRDSAKAEADQSRSRIRSLEEQKWPVSMETASQIQVRHAFVGYEWAFPTAVLIISQISWYVTFGSFGHGRVNQASGFVARPDQTNGFLGEPNRQDGEPKPDRFGSTEPVFPLKTNEKPEKPASRTIVVGSPVDHPAAVARLRATPDQVVELENQVLALVAKEKSERKIALELGIPRSRVQRIKKAAQH